MGTTGAGFLTPPILSFVAIVATILVRSAQGPKAGVRSLAMKKVPW